MTNTPKSGREICDMARTENGALGYGEELMFHRGYRQAESELLPVINQQAEEIDHWKKEAERMQGLYAQMIELDLTRRADIVDLRSKHLTASNDYREETRLRLDAQSDRDELLTEKLKLEEENEKLKAEVTTATENDRFRTELLVKNRIVTKRRLFEVMQKECPEDGEEVDKISEDTLIEAIESYIWDMRVELITKNDALQTRFDELVKENEKLTSQYHEIKKYASSAIDRETALNIRFDRLLKELEEAVRKAIAENTLAGSLGLVKFEDIQSIIKQARGE